MTPIPPSLLALGVDPVAGAPSARLTVRPGSPEAVADVLAVCSATGLRVLVWGGGAHQGIGYPVEPDVVLSTAGLDRVVDHQVEDLTLVVEGGVTLAAIRATLEPHQQMALVPEIDLTSTIGGVLAAGVSGYRRSRYGPTRDHLLEVTLATGDGRLVRAGGRVVKNVQGYDLMRLATGSLGSLGVIVQVCLKLWPTPVSKASVMVASPADGLAGAFRPWAVLETAEGTTVYLAGTSEEVASQTLRLGGTATDGHHWPALPDGGAVWSVRVPPSETSEAVRRLPRGVPFIAQHGVGVVDAALDDPTALRTWAEAVGGSVVRLRADGPSDAHDPWGTPPSSLPLQRRIVARFDPDRVVNPGRLPGGL